MSLWIAATPVFGVISPFGPHLECLAQAPPARRARAVDTQNCHHGNCFGRSKNLHQSLGLRPERFVAQPIAPIEAKQRLQVGVISEGNL